jgi:uncharacterized protein YcfL
MKKAFLLLIIPGMMLISCGSKDKGENSLSEQEKQELIQETEALDALSKSMENAKGDIESSAAKLDELLNDL